MFLVVTIMMQGCALFSAASDQEKYYAVQEAYIVSVQALVALKVAGHIDQDLWNDTLNPIIQEGNLLLNEAWVQLNAGNFDAFELLLNALLTNVMTLQTEAGQ